MATSSRASESDDVRVGAETHTGNSREQQLMEQALIFFSEGGYRETSLQEIADKLGITRPLFYYYFDSKSDLLWRLIGHLGDGLLEGARPLAASEKGPREKLLDILMTHAVSLMENREAFKIYFAERHLVEEKYDNQMRKGEAAYVTLVSEVIRAGQERREFREGNVRALTLMLTGFANSVVRWYSPEGELSPSDLGRLLAEISVRGISVK